jgi:hypothetical protein
MMGYRDDVVYQMRQPIAAVVVIRTKPGGGYSRNRKI